jgi:hypothetical protein
MVTRPIVIAGIAGTAVIIVVATGGVLRMRQAQAVGAAIADAPPTEPLPFSVVEIRAGAFAEAWRGRTVLAGLAPVEPFEMVDGVMRIEVDLPLAGLRQALSSPDLKTSAGERFVIDEELPQTGTLRVHLAR